MSAGTVRQEVTSIPGANKHTNNVLKEQPPVIRMPARNNTTPVSSTYQGEKQPSLETAVVEETVAETEVATPTKEERKTQRKEEWSALEAARKEKREAETLRKQAQSFEQVKNSPQKLQALAKSLGVTEGELLRQLNNEMLSLPNEKKLTPQEQAVAEAKAYKDQLDAQAKQIQEITFFTVKNSHINKAILPLLIKEPDNFEFCHKYGIDRCASEVYDYCNQSFQDGVALNESEVLQEFEQALFEEWKSNLDTGKNTKKASKYFEESTTTPAKEALGATVQNLKEGQKVAEAAVSQTINDPAAKRIAKKTAAALPPGVDMDKLSANNKLTSSASSKPVYDKAERRRRVLMGE